MNTPDTEWEANMQVETLHSILADISSFEPDGEVYTLVEQAHTELAKLRTIILSRDTYWKEKVRILVSKNTGQDEFDVVEFLNALNNLK